MGIRHWIIFDNEPPVEWRPGIDPRPISAKHIDAEIDGEIQPPSFRFDTWEDPDPDPDPDLGLVVDTVMSHMGMTERISFGKAGYVQSSLSGMLQMQEHQVRRSTLEVAHHEIKLSEAQQEIQALQESNW